MRPGQDTADLKQIVEDVAAVARPLCKKSSIVLDLDLVDLGDAAVVMGDPSLIRPSVMRLVLEAREAVLGEILNLRRQVAKVRRSIGPQRDVIGRLARHDLDFVSPKCSIYFRDVYDHVVRVHEMLEGIRDVIGGLTEPAARRVS